MVLAHEREDDEHDVLRAVAVILGSGGGRQRAEPEEPRARGARAAALQEGAAADQPPITALVPLGANCGSVPPASSSSTRQSRSTTSGCSSATSVSSSGSACLS